MSDRPEHSSPFDDAWSAQLDDLTDQGLRRRLRTVTRVQGAMLEIDGRELLSFCSNDYLGLTQHPRVIEAVRESLDTWGWGSGASALITGFTEPHARLVDKLAAFKRKPAAMICSTGYQANHTAIRTAAGKGDVIFLDKLNHASIIDAAHASGATVRVYPHGSYDKLERLLARTQDARQRVIVSDSLFSMDGDFADVPRLVALKNQYRACLILDEAHAVGVWGATGRGLAEHFHVEDEVDIIVGTLSKALGGVGGFVAGSRAFIDLAINTARALIYTTSLPPAACAASVAALELIDDEPERRQSVLELAEQLRHALNTQGWDTSPSVSQIVPVHVGDSERAVQLSHTLEQAGMLVPAIRPPTVPRGQARLRINLTAHHEPAHVERLLQALGRPA